MQTATIQCPKCDACYQVSPKAIGRTVQCSKCSAKFSARQSPGTTPKPPPSSSSDSGPSLIDLELLDSALRERAAEEIRAETDASKSLSSSHKHSKPLPRNDWQRYVNRAYRTLIIVTALAFNGFIYLFLSLSGMSASDNPGNGPLLPIVVGLSLFATSYVAFKLIKKGIRFGEDARANRGRGLAYSVTGVVVFSVSVVISIAISDAWKGGFIIWVGGLGIGASLTVFGALQFLTGHDVVGERARRE